MPWTEFVATKVWSQKVLPGEFGPAPESVRSFW